MTHNQENKIVRVRSSCLNQSPDAPIYNYSNIYAAFTACEENDVATLDNLISTHRVDVNVLDEKLVSLFDFACIHGSMNVAEYIYELKESFSDRTDTEMLLLQQYILQHSSDNLFQRLFKDHVQFDRFKLLPTVLELVMEYNNLHLLQYTFEQANSLERFDQAVLLKCFKQACVSKQEELVKCLFHEILQLDRVNEHVMQTYTQARVDVYIEMIEILCHTGYSNLLQYFTDHTYTIKHGIPEWYHQKARGRLVLAQVQNDFEQLTVSLFHNSEILLKDQYIYNEVLRTAVERGQYDVIYILVSFSVRQFLQKGHHYVDQSILSGMEYVKNTQSFEYVQKLQNNTSNANIPVPKHQISNGTHTLKKHNRIARLFTDQGCPQPCVSVVNEWQRLCSITGNYYEWKWLYNRTKQETGDVSFKYPGVNELLNAILWNNIHSVCAFLILLCPDDVLKELSFDKLEAGLQEVLTCIRLDVLEDPSVRGMVDSSFTLGKQLEMNIHDATIRSGSMDIYQLLSVFRIPTPAITHTTLTSAMLCSNLELTKHVFDTTDWTQWTGESGVLYLCKVAAAAQTAEHQDLYFHHTWQPLAVTPITEIFFSELFVKMCKYNLRLALTYLRFFPSILTRRTPKCNPFAAMFLTDEPVMKEIFSEFVDHECPFDVTSPSFFVPLLRTYDMAFVYILEKKPLLIDTMLEAITTLDFALTQGLPQCEDELEMSEEMFAYLFRKGKIHVNHIDEDKQPLLYNIKKHASPRLKELIDQVLAMEMVEISE